MCSAGGKCSRDSIGCRDHASCMGGQGELQLAKTSLRRCPSLTDSLTYPDDTQASDSVDC